MPANYMSKLLRSRVFVSIAILGCLTYLFILFGTREKPIMIMPILLLVMPFLVSISMVSTPFGISLWLLCTAFLAGFVSLGFYGEMNPLMTIRDGILPIIILSTFSITITWCIGVFLFDVKKIKLAFKITNCFIAVLLSTGILFAQLWNFNGEIDINEFNMSLSAVIERGLNMFFFPFIVPGLIASTVADFKTYKNKCRDN